MMTLYIFNPEHDIALASGLSHFTAPRAGRQLRHDLSFLPIIWAKTGDAVLVDDTGLASRTAASLGIGCEGAWLTRQSAAQYIAAHPGRIVAEPWGWDAPLVTGLRRIGFTDGMLPDGRQTAQIRQCSHRLWALTHMLKPLRGIRETAGMAWPACRIDDVEQAISQYGTVVIKVPWSSSGRGVRIISKAQLTTGLRGWMARIVAQQGCVMIEPFYRKLIDTGMEFSIDSSGEVSYEGASLFETMNGAYAGNRIDSEQAKEQYLFQFIPKALWLETRTALLDLLHRELSPFYRGMLGVDMMVVETGGGLRLHPCVELNLRTTMGHVALQLHRRLGWQHKSMRISFDGQHYRLSIEEAK